MTWLACARCGRTIVADVDLCFAVDDLETGEQYRWDKRDVPDVWIWGEDEEGMPIFGLPDTEPLHEACAAELPSVLSRRIDWTLAHAAQRVVEWELADESASDAGIDNVKPSPAYL